MNLYIDYSEFELTCWNTDGKGTNVAIPLVGRLPQRPDSSNLYLNF